MQNLNKLLQMKAEIVKHMGEATDAMRSGQQSSLMRILYLDRVAVRHNRGEDAIAEEMLQAYAEATALQ